MKKNPGAGNAGVRIEECLVAFAFECGATERGQHMPSPHNRSNSKSATPKPIRYLNLCGEMTPTEFVNFHAACQEIGVFDAAYLYGFPVWDCGKEVYVFSGEGPD